MFTRTVHALQFAVISVSLAVSSAAGAGCHSAPGSYMRTDVSDINAYADEVITLNADGTGTYSQGNVLEYFGSTGSFTPGIGTWGCGPNGTVVLTTVHYATDGGDNLLSGAYRVTYQLLFDKKDMEHPKVVNRVWIFFTAAEAQPTSNILDPNGGTVISPPLTEPRQFALVKPFISDLSR